MRDVFFDQHLNRYVADIEGEWIILEASNITDAIKEAENILEKALTSELELFIL